jgi:hypothetical protein
MFFFAVVTSIPLFFLLNEPPAIPLDPLRGSVDCQNVFPVNISANNSHIEITVSVGDFYEFEPSVVLRLMRVFTTTGNILSEYSWSHFWDVNQSGPNLSFAILHGFAGNVNTVLICHTRPVIEAAIVVTHIAIYPPGMTQAVTRPHLIGQFADFCYANNSLHIFGQPATFPSFMNAAFDYVIPYAAYQTHAAIFAATPPTSTIFQEQVFFVSSSATTAVEQLYDVIIPLWGALAVSPQHELVRVYLTRNQTHLMKNIRKIIKTEFLFNDTRGCFADGSFMKAVGPMPLDVASQNTTRADAIAAQLIWTMTFAPEVFVLLRSQFTKKNIVKGRIVIDEVAAQLLPDLQLWFPTATIVAIPTTDDLSVIADCIAQAALFIATRIESLAFALFLSPGAGVVEMQPTGFECTAFGIRWVTAMGGKYRPLRTGTCAYCSYTDIACYLLNGTSYDAVRQEELLEVVTQLLPLEI